MPLQDITTVTSVTALTILLGFPEHVVGENVRQLIELLFVKWLRL